MLKVLLFTAYLTSCAFSVGAYADTAGEAARYYEDALARYERRDDAGAVIQLKNALKQDRRMLPALVLLGQVYLRQAQPAAAENVLVDAERLGAARAQIAGLQAQAYYDQGKFQALIEKFGASGLPPQQQIDVLLLRARAYFDLAQFEAATAAAQQAARIPGGETRGLALLSKIHLNAGHIEEARALVRQALMRSPRDADALTMRASVAHAEGALETAARDYGQALAANPDQRDARLARAAIWLDLKLDADAKVDIDYLQQKFPADPRGIYLGAVYYERRGDNARAQNAMRELARTVDQLSTVHGAAADQLQLLGGLAHYALHEYERAQKYLEMYLERHAEATGARKLLANIYLAGRHPERAIAVLQPALTASPNDGRVLAMLAEAYMAQGNHNKAASLFKEATVADRSPDIQTGLGVSLMRTGQKEAGFAALQDAYQHGGESSRAGVPLALTFMQRGEPKRAIPIVEAMLKREPRNISALNLLGMARQAAGDRVGARAAYLSAVQVAPNFYTAHLNLARIDETDGQVARARARYMAILKVVPDHVDAMLELGRLEESAGRVGEAVRWLEKARNARARDLRSNLALHALYLRHGQARQALDAAKDAQAIGPENPVVLMALAQGQIAVGNTDLARVSLMRLAQIVSFNAPRLTRIAALQLQIGDREAARYTLSKAVLADANYLPARVVQVRMELRNGNINGAEKQAEALLAQDAHNLDMQQLMGEIRMRQKRYADAESIYRNIYAVNPTQPNLFGLNSALLATGKLSEAASLMGGWCSHHPNDRAAAHALGEIWIALNDMPRARAVYQQMLSLDAQDARAHNNLATVLLQSGDASALMHAEKARALAPNQPQVNDTLGWVLVRQGQTEKGLRYLREAVLRAPEDAQIQAHLATALAQQKAASSK